MECCYCYFLLKIQFNGTIEFYFKVSKLFFMLFSLCSLNFMVEALIFCFLILSLFEAVRYCSLLPLLLQWDPHAGGWWQLALISRAGKVRPSVACGQLDSVTSLEQT